MCMFGLCIGVCIEKCEYFGVYGFMWLLVGGVCVCLVYLFVGVYLGLYMSV